MGVKRLKAVSDRSNQKIPSLATILTYAGQGLEWLKGKNKGQERIENIRIINRLISKKNSAQNVEWHKTKVKSINILNYVSEHINYYYTQKIYIN